MFRNYNRNKYGNKKTEIDGIRFDSKREANRYLELKLFEKTGLIKNLRLQQVFLIHEKFTDKLGIKHREINYKADFTYLDKSYNWQMVVEDCKGFKTPEYKIKKKLLIKKYDVIFIET